MATGGLTKGKSHAEGGIPMTVKDTGQNIEVEGGEIIINKKSVADPQKHSFDGEKLTKCEIASKINEADGNGVKIDCDSVEGKKYKFEQGGKTEELSEIFDDYYKKGGNIIELKNGLGYDKSTLPQIRSGKKSDFSKYLNEKYDRKMTYNVMVVASTLKPVQSQINLGQLQAIQKGGFKSGKPITISNDGYVIDGHHRWYYANQNNMSLPALKIDLPAKAVIRESFESGLAEVDDINTIRNVKQDGGIVSKQYKNKPIPLTLYKSFFIDTDSDGIPNVDDVAPFSAEIKLNLEEVSLSDEMRTIIDYRNDYEKVRKEVVEDLKEIINECDVKQQCGIFSRTKTPYSIVNKLRRRSLTDVKDLDKLEQKAKSKLKDKDLTGIDLYKGLTDVVGTMVVTPNKKNADKIKDAINKGKIGKVLEFEDFYENPNNGYRAYHFLIAVQKDGKTFPVEVQVKTERVKKLAGLSHTVYKRGNLNAKGFNKLNELALKSDKGDKQAQKKFDKILKDSKQLSKLIEKKPTKTIIDKDIKFDIGGSLEYDYYTKYEDDAQKFIDEAYFVDDNLFDENKSEELEKLFEDSIDKSFELRKKYQLKKLEENNMTADNEKRKKAKALLNQYKIKMADGGQATDRYTQMKKDFNISYFDRHASMSGDTRDKLLSVGQYPTFVLYEDNRLDIPYTEDEAKKIKMQLKKAGFDDATFKNQMSGLYDGFDYTENDRFRKNFEIIEELDPKFFQVLNPIIKEVKAYPRTEYPNRGLFDKGGLVVRGYGEIPYMDIEDISASYQDEDGEYQIDKIDIIDIDGGTSDEIFKQVSDLVGEDVETVEFVKTDGDFFDVYDMNDEFDVEQWNKRYQFAKGGKTQNEYVVEVLIDDEIDLGTNVFANSEDEAMDKAEELIRERNSKYEDSSIDIVNVVKINAKGGMITSAPEYQKVRNAEYNRRVESGKMKDTDDNFERFDEMYFNELVDKGRIDPNNYFAKGGILENMFEGYDSMYQYALANNLTPRQLAEELKFMTNLGNKGDKDLYDFLNSLTDMFPDTPISEFTKGGGKMAKGGEVSVYGINGIYYLKKYGTTYSNPTFKTKKEAENVARLVNKGEYKLTNFGLEYIKEKDRFAKGGMISESEKRTFIKHAQNYLKDFYDDEESANFRIKQDYLPNLKKLDDKRYQVEYNGSAGTLIKQEFTLSDNSLKDIKTFEKNLMDKNPKWEKFVYAKGGKLDEYYSKMIEKLGKEGAFERVLKDSQFGIPKDNTDYQHNRLNKSAIINDGKVFLYDNKPKGDGSLKYSNLKTFTSPKDLAEYLDENEIFAKGGVIPFSSSNLYFNGFGKDSNGNSVIKVSFPNSRAFSIQTNGNLPKTHSLKKQYLKIENLSEKDLKVVEKEVNDYVKEFGSDSQIKKLNTYAKGGEVKELRDISNALKKGSKLHAKQSEQLMGASKSHIKQSEELDKIADELTEMQKLVKTYEQGGLITGNPIEKLIPYYQLQALKEGEQEIKSGLRDEPLFLDDLNNAYKLVPPEYEPIGTGMNKVAFFHYFYGGSDWYITELDKKSNYAMGYVILNGDTQMSEYGSININELTDKSIGNILSNVNIDQYFKPQTLNQIFQSKYPELVQGEIEIYEDKKEVDVVETTDYLNMDFKNPYERNLVIRKLIDEKGDIGNNYSIDEKEFIQLYSGMGGLEKFGATEGLLYEYYTPKDIVQKMWGLAFKHKLGTQKIEVCVEPSVATGNFVGYAPENVKMIGYDIDKYAYSICNAIYGNEKHEFYNVSFEKLFINNRNQSVKDKIEPFCDLVIGNPPYGKYSGLYAGMGEKKYTGAEDFIDYFIFRSLDILKSGGLLVFIIGKLTQLGGQRFTDKIAKNPNRCQLEIRQKSNLVDAYRLPVGVFDTTQVESEIIVLRKK